MLQLLLSLVLLLGGAWSNPKPDFAVPATLIGVSTGSLDTSGNIVQNIDRIGTILNQFHSIVESLYYVESPELNEAAQKFRTVMDSLVETGSPIFQGLSNVAKVSTGNITKAFNAIRGDIVDALDLAEENMALVNSTSPILGENTTNYFSNALEQLAENLVNVTTQLDSIEEAIIAIQRQNPNSQAAIRALAPNEAIKTLNAVLRQYIAIGDTTVPEIRSVVNRVRNVDSFLARIRSVFSQMRTSIEVGLARLPASLDSSWKTRVDSNLVALKNQISTLSARAGAGLANLLSGDKDDLTRAAQLTAVALSQMTENFTSHVNAILERVVPVRVVSDMDDVFNYTQSVALRASDQLVQSVTQRTRNADSCFSQYNYEFDKIPRMLYSQVYSCAWDRTSQLSEVAQDLSYVGRLAQSSASYAIQAVQRCSALVSSTSTPMARNQAAVCLIQARNYILNQLPFARQLASYRIQMQHETAYEANADHFCMASSLTQAVFQCQYLQEQIYNCLNKP